MIWEQVAQSKSAFFGNRPSSFCFCLKRSSVQAFFLRIPLTPFLSVSSQLTTQKKHSRSPRLRTIPAAPFLSKCGKPKDTAGSLTYGKWPNTGRTVVPESNRIATIRIFCDMEFNERDCFREDNHKAQNGHTSAAWNRKKRLQRPKRCCSRFPATNATTSRTCRRGESNFA